MQYLLFSVLAVLAVGLFAAPQAFADHDEITIENAPGSSTPGCEETADGCFIPSVVVLAKADTEITWENNDTAAHTVTSGNA
jgi:plastocyanin